MRSFEPAIAEKRARLCGLESHWGRLTILIFTTLYGEAGMIALAGQVSYLLLVTWLGTHAHRGSVSSCYQRMPFCNLYLLNLFYSPAGTGSNGLLQCHYVVRSDGLNQVALFPALTGSIGRKQWLKTPHSWLILSAILINLPVNFLEVLLYIEKKAKVPLSISRV